MGVCEVCGKADQEEEAQTSSGIDMGILHVCASCRADRQYEPIEEDDSQATSADG